MTKHNFRECHGLQNEFFRFAGCVLHGAKGWRLNEVLTVDSLYGCRAVGRERQGTLLADALLPVKSHSVAGWERLSAHKTQRAT